MADSGMEAQGFSSAANKVIGEIDNYLNQYNLVDAFREGRVKFWLTGYSRAGATANLASKRLVDKIAQECAGEQSQVFGYTCEAPQGGTDLAEVPENNYFCIHNMINAVDIVPFVAPSLMGFKRYGVDHYVPGTNAGEVQTTQKKITRGSEGGPSTVTTHADNEPVKTKTDAFDIQKSEMLYQLKALNSSTSYNDSFRPYALDFLSFEFPFDFETMKIYEEGNKDNNRAEDFVADFVRFLQEGLNPGDLYGKGKAIANRDQYARDPYKLDGTLYPTTQTALRDVMQALWGMSKSEREAFMSAAKNIKDYIPTIAHTPTSKDPCPIGYDVIYLLIGNWNGAAESTKAHVIQHLWDALEQTGALSYLHGEDAANLKRDFPTLVNFVFKFLDGDYRYEPGEHDECQGWAKGSDESMMYLATFLKSADYILSCHEPAVNAAWVRSYDSWYSVDGDVEYTLAQPDGVEMPKAYGTVGGMQQELVEGEDKENWLPGDQRITLDNDQIVGEAIYYDLYEINVFGNGERSEHQVARNQIYCGGIDLAFVNTFQKSYRIETYAMSYGIPDGVPSQKAVYCIMLCEPSHQVLVQDMPEDGQEGIPMGSEAERLNLPEGYRQQEYTYEEGQSVTLTASVPPAKYFKAWKVQLLNNKGEVVKEDVAAELLGQNANKATVDFTMPCADVSTYPVGYQLRFFATYGDGVQTIVVKPDIPQTRVTLNEYTQVTLGNGKTIRCAVEWYDYIGRNVGRAEPDTEYTAKIHIGRDDANDIVFADDVTMETWAEEGVVTSTSIQKDDAGGITIQITFANTEAVQ